MGYTEIYNGLIELHLIRTGQPIVSPKRLSAVVFRKTSQMHTLYCISNTDRREADPSACD